MRPEDTQYDDLTSEPEEDEALKVEFDISVSPADPTLQNLSDQIASKDIIIPDYQRKFVWNMNQSSRLIESFLMGLPIPQVFLYINPENQLEIIDGQQRLMSISYFFGGFFGDPASKSRRRKFKLQGLKQRPEYNGKVFKDLSERDQRRLRNTSLRTVNIKQIFPDKHNDSVFHIFERLNTGGTNLKPQEIRNAVYRGPIVDVLRGLNNNRKWQEMLGLKKPDRSERDVELVLRVFSLYQEWQSYSGPMLGHLNEAQNMNRQFDSVRAKAFKIRFPQAVSLLAAAVDRPFQPKSRVNTAAVDSLMVTVMENENLTLSQLQANHPILLKDEQYQDCLASGTADKGKVILRHQRAKKILNNGLG